MNQAKMRVDVEQFKAKILSKGLLDLDLMREFERMTSTWELADKGSITRSEMMAVGREICGLAVWAKSRGIVVEKTIAQRAMKALASGKLEDFQVMHGMGEHTVGWAPHSYGYEWNGPAGKTADAMAELLAAPFALTEVWPKWVVFPTMPVWLTWALIVLIVWGVGSIVGGVIDAVLWPLIELVDSTQARGMRAP
jgi:hypothetical protein